MLKLLLRQIKKHRAGLIPVLLAWVIGGTLLFKYNDSCLAALSRLVVRLPEPGTQRPVEALKYLEDARGIIAEKEIRLDLMARLCGKTPIKWTDDRELYRPHWLEKIRSWNLATAPDASAVVIEPDEYWKENRPVVLEALSLVMNAQALAFEITAADRALPEGETILVPDELGRYARALCNDQIAVLAWGDYVEFQEIRAFRRMMTADPNLEETYRYPVEQEILILESLREDPLYLRALREYAAGDPPLPEGGGTCGDTNFRLPCAAPRETLKVWNKELYFAPAAARPALHLRLGRLHRVLAKEAGTDEHLLLALDQFTGATVSIPLEEEARLGLTRLFLMLADRAPVGAPRREFFERAYDEIKMLSLITRGRGLTDREFRELTRHTLIGLGRFQDADCFADLARNVNGGLTRPHCQDFRL